MGDAGVYIHHVLSAQHDLHSSLGRGEHIFHTDLQRPLKWLQRRRADFMLDASSNDR